MNQQVLKFEAFRLYHLTVGLSCWAEEGRGKRKSEKVGSTKTPPWSANRNLGLTRWDKLWRKDRGQRWGWPWQTGGCRGKNLYCCSAYKVFDRKKNVLFILYYWNKFWNIFACVWCVPFFSSWIKDLIWASLMSMESCLRK